MITLFSLFIKFLKRLSIFTTLVLLSSFSLADKESEDNVFNLLKGEVPNYLSPEIYTLYTSTKNFNSNNSVPSYKQENNLSCKEQIFAVVAIENNDYIAETSYLVPVYIHWINPQGKVQEKTAVTLPFFQGKGRSYAWLKLHQPSGASMLGFIDDSLGLEKFIGEWNIELLINGHNIKSHSFKVLC